MSQMDRSKLTAAATGPAEPGFGDRYLRAWDRASDRARRAVVAVLVLALTMLFVGGYLAYQSTTDYHQLRTTANEVDHQHARVVSVLAQGNEATKACEKDRDPYTCGQRANRLVARNLSNIRHDIAKLALPAAAAAPQRELVASLRTLIFAFEAIKDVRTPADAQHLQDEIARDVSAMDATFQDLSNAVASP